MSPFLAENRVRGGGICHNTLVFGAAFVKNHLLANFKYSDKFSRAKS